MLTRGEPLLGLNSNSRLLAKGWVDVNGSDERSSLLRYGYNYGSKTFYQTGLKPDKQKIPTVLNDHSCPAFVAGLFSALSYTARLS